ncbi:MAG: hypothetical protein JOZ22_22080 [Acidobacteriia bacterium]|nr:hypothetical protein [Terriglobia bacterium]
MIEQLSLRRLRAAIQKDEISFPSQVPVFARQSRADIQWRLVELYFVCNWSCAALGRRYGVSMERARQLISQWVRRAVFLGYLQEIPEAYEFASSLAEREPALRIPARVLEKNLETDAVALAISN